MNVLHALAIALLASTVVAQPSPPPEMAAATQKIAEQDFAGAIAILEEFSKQQPARARPLLLRARFEQAAVHASKQEHDQALALLGTIRATGSFDFDQFHNDARFAELRKDPRFIALLPKPADFANPFVEKTRVIHEFRGDVKNGQFGWIARRVGDIDGDRIADFTTSAPTYPVDGQPAGRVYVYSTRSGRLLWQVTGKAGEQLGVGIEGAGDVNRDGVPDVVAGAPGSGRAYVYSGRDGKPLLTLGDGKAADQFGRHTSTAGDVNGDGHGDVFVGAPGAASGAGRAFVYSGKDGALLLALDGEKAGDAFGSTIAGSVDAKEKFLLVGAPGAGPRGTGRVYVYKGLSPKPAFTFDSDETGGALGAMFLSVVGDTNGDRVPDLYLSDWANSAKGRGTGRVYVLSGKDGALLFTLTGEGPGDGFGIGAADAGDVDRDGADDLIVGAWQHASGATSAGRIYVYSGRTQKLLRTITCRTPGDTFGFDTTNLGDVDRDGAIDFLVTSAWSGVNGFQSGRVFVIAGSRTTAPTRADRRALPGSRSDPRRQSSADRRANR